MDDSSWSTLIPNWGYPSLSVIMEETASSTIQEIHRTPFTTSGWGDFYFKFEYSLFMFVCLNNFFHTALLSGIFWHSRAVLMLLASPSIISNKEVTQFSNNVAVQTFLLRCENWMKPLFPLSFPHLLTLPDTKCSFPLSLLPFPLSLSHVCTHTLWLQRLVSGADFSRSSVEPGLFLPRESSLLLLLLLSWPRPHL